MAAIYTAQTAWRHLSPLGDTTRQFNDLASQLVPFMSEYRRVLHGQAPLTNLFFTWTTGGGVPALGDYYTYLGGPILPLLLFFTPETALEAAAFAWVVAQLALAAIFMAVLLQDLSRFPTWSSAASESLSKAPFTPLAASGNPIRANWVTVALSVAYGLNAWSINDAVYVPMWLAGAVGLPLLVLVARQASRRWNARVLLTGSLVVALVWWSNFYTAYMASLGAAVILVIMLFAAGVGWRNGLVRVGRFAWQGILGVGLNGVFLAPTFFQISQATAQEGEVPHPPALLPFLGHVLPGAESVSLSPSFATSALVFLAVPALCFMRGFPRRWRLAWTLGLLLLIASFMFPATLWVWNGFDTPNGSLWRGAFVVVAAAILVAFQVLRNLEAVPLKVWLGSGLLLGLASFWQSLPGANRSFFPGFALVSAAIFAVLLGLSRARSSRHRRVLAPGLSVALTALVVLETGGSTAWIESRQRELFRENFPALSAADFQAARDTLEHAAWPQQRPLSSAAIRPNLGTLYGLPLVDGYSSLLPQATSEWLSHNLAVDRSPIERIIVANRDDPVGLSLVATLRPGQSPGQNPVMPLVHMTPAATPEMTPHEPPDLFHRRNQLWGHPIYTRVPLQPSGATPAAGTLEALNPGDQREYRYTCPAGSHAFWDGSRFDGEVRLAAARSLPANRVVNLGVATGKAETLRLQATVENRRFPREVPRWIGCLHPEILDQTVQKLVVPRITLSPGQVTARFPAPQSGTAVIATAALPGWECVGSTTSNPATPTTLRKVPREGFLAVQLNGQDQLQCAYRPPRLRLGLGITLMSLVGMALGCWYLARRGRGIE